MKKHLTRAISLVIALIMVVSMMILPASAALEYRKGTNSASSSYMSGRYYTNYTKLTLCDDDRNNLLAVALSQLGYQEGASDGKFSGTVGGSSNYVEFSYNAGDWGVGYGGSDYPWCASFVSWSLFQSRCTDHGKASTMCRNHKGDSTYIWKEFSCSQWVNQVNPMGYYKKSAYRGGSYTPIYGDLIIFQNSKGPCHIGIVMYVKGGKVYTVEGNTSPGNGVVVPNGGGVYFKSYSLSASSIHGYIVLPFKNSDKVSNIDYSGANPTAGLYMTNGDKSIYASASTSSTEKAVIPAYRMFEATEVSADGMFVKTTYDGVTGWVYNSSTHTKRILQVTSTGAGSSSSGNLASGATVTTFEVKDGARANVNMKTRGFTGALTDGKYSQVGPYDAGGSVAEWFGFFMNEAVPTEENCSTGLGHVMVNMGSAKDVACIRVNVSNTEGTAPGKLVAYAGTSEYALTEVGTLSMPTTGYGWAVLNLDKPVSAQFIRIDVTVNGHWALLNEVQAFAEPDKDSPVGGGTTAAPSVEEWAHDAIGATVVDKFNDAPLISSSSGCRFGTTSVLTDGKVTTGVVADDQSWYTIQRWWNAETTDSGYGELTLDLGATFAIEAVKLHLGNTLKNAPNVGYSVTAPAPASIYITLLDENMNEVASGNIEPKKDAELVYWSDAFVANKAEARYVVVGITVGGTVDTALYALLDEIAVFGAEVDDDNIAYNQTVISAPSATRGYTAALTDGIADAYFAAGTPGAEENASWFGLFTNADAGADENCPTGVADIIIDLSTTYDLSQVKVHIAACDGVNAPTSVVASVAVTENGTYRTIGELKGEAEEDGTYWISVDATGFNGRYLKITVTVDTVSEYSYWAMINEVKAYGVEGEPANIYDLGDVNLDGVVDKKDYAVLKRHCFGATTLTGDALAVADVNKDSTVDKKDYAVLKRFCFGVGTI